MLVRENASYTYRPVCLQITGSAFHYPLASNALQLHGPEIVRQRGDTNFLLYPVDDVARYPQIHAKELELVGGRVWSQQRCIPCSA
jgi:hypothetical protein